MITAIDDHRTFAPSVDLKWPDVTREPTDEPDQETIPQPVQADRRQADAAPLVIAEFLEVEPENAVVACDEKQSTRDPQRQAVAVMRLVSAFIAVLFTLFVFGSWAQGSSANSTRVVPWDDLLRRLQIGDGLLSAVVIAALCWLPRPILRKGGLERYTATAWLLAGPVLAILLVLNVTYVAWLRSLLGITAQPPGYNVLSTEFAWLVVLLCVQPAIFEELFFRHLALGTIQSIAGIHTAALISALMFALAHIGNPLGMPYLFLFGVVLGYMRTARGGLLLCMALHLLHNLVAHLPISMMLWIRQSAGPSL